MAGKVIGTLFRQTSTRTRSAFTVAAMRLGASVISYGPDDLQLKTGETVTDTGRVLAGVLDALVARTAGDPGELAELAAGGLPVVNAMSADEHPTQALADLTVLRRRFGELSGLRVLYVGEGNNTAAALALAMARIPGSELWVRTPAGYGIPPETLNSARAAAARHGASIREQGALDALPRGVDVVYTTRWCTTGTTKADPEWRAAFEPFRVDDELMSRWPGALFMHDLPAHRGEEVTGSVLDGSRSIAFEQAQAKLWSAAAVLEWVVRPEAPHPARWREWARFERAAMPAPSRPGSVVP